MPEHVPLAVAGRLPHGSILRCRSGDEQHLAATGAAVLTPQGWMFPVHAVGYADDIAGLQNQLDTFLTKAKLTPLGTPLSLPPRWRTETLDA